MDTRLPIPKNWQDFESICHRLWMDIWNDFNTQKNGRQGQSQNGVDIFGQPLYDPRYHAVQCKGKDGRLGSVLTQEEFIAECKKAENFNPKIFCFTLATTSPRDAKIQEFYRELNDNKKFSFETNIWSWDDIENEIAYRPAILQHYYSNIYIPEPVNNIVKLNRLSSKDHFHAFFSRPSVNDKISKKFKSFLVPVIYELMDNAYKYGDATNLEIILENNKIIIKDNGKEFNPLLELDHTKANANSNVGSFVVKTFLKKFEEMTTSYKFEENFNILQFIVNDSILNIDDDSYFELNIDLCEAYGRDNAKKLASHIPLDKNEIILNVNQVYNISAFFEFISETLNRMAESQRLTVSIPRHDYFSLLQNWLKDERLTIKMR